MHTIPFLDNYNNFQNMKVKKGMPLNLTLKNGVPIYFTSVLRILSFLTGQQIT